MMSASDALSVVRRAGADVVIAGGRGVDALLGEETRSHKDLGAADLHDMARLRRNFGVATHF
ncbi:nucleotidyltransferase domain-containing protein [Streptomyces sp. BE230]|uniref:nucleotidyltransferase domain-containing protein n=1 Tax=Streptomyces sp. BE230 TaxID=3002526 RepID=UPI002ED1F77D|nr:hypothetical protein [Streptomyces sp. BE230]